MTAVSVSQGDVSEEDERGPVSSVSRNCAICEIHSSTKSLLITNVRGTVVVGEVIRPYD